MKKKMNAPKKQTLSKQMQAAAEGEDIVELILQDHKPLKKMIKILKDPDVPISKKRPCFEEFAPTLLSHADPEQNSLYVYMKDEETDLRVESFEGETEHTIAGRLIDEIKATEDDDQWMARVKVLAEAVEHHIKEEEDEILKDVKKSIPAEARAEIGANYARLRQEFKAPQMNAKMKREKSSEARLQ